MSIGYIDYKGDLVPTKRYTLDDCTYIRTPKINTNPFCPVCVLHNRRMTKEKDTWKCTECGRSFPIEDIRKEDMDREDDELIKLMRSKIIK